MVDFNKLDTLFAEDVLADKAAKEEEKYNRHTRRVRIVKLLLPAVAAALAGLLVILPEMQEKKGEFQLNIPKPKEGELEKLHIENTVFYITDSKNRVNNFVAKAVDEITPGSKLIKLIEPEGLLPTSDEQWVSIKSPVGYYDQNKEFLWLDNIVTMVYSDGMTATTQTVYYDNKKSMAYSTTPVTSKGYFGTLDSEGFEYYKDQKKIVFTGHSKIIIRKQKKEDDTK